MTRTFEVTVLTYGMIGDRLSDLVHELSDFDKVSNPDVQRIIMNLDAIREECDRRVGHAQMGTPPSNNQFDLVNLQVSPTEARMLATAASKEGMRTANGIGAFIAPEVSERLASNYRELAAKVDRQRRL